MASGPPAQGCQARPSAKHTWQPLGPQGCCPLCTAPLKLMKGKTILSCVRKNTVGGGWHFCVLVHFLILLFYLCLSCKCFLRLVSFYFFFFFSHNAMENYSAFSYFLWKLLKKTSRVCLSFMFQWQTPLQTSQVNICSRRRFILMATSSFSHVDIY